MNEQAQKVLADLLQRAVSGVDAAVNFSQSQIPDVIHQLLVWKFTQSVIGQIFSIIVIVCLVIMVNKGLKNKGVKEEKKEGRYETYGRSYIWHGLFYDNEGDITVFCIMSIIASIFMSLAMIALFLNNFDWLQIWIAPKLYLIEYAASLVK